MLPRKIITTADGSKTLQIPEWNETYHSRHGSLQEAQHVYLDQGISLINRQNIHILEMGFGTGLNALLTLYYAKKHKLNITYTSLEKYPLSSVEIKELEYYKLIGEDIEAKKLYFSLHDAKWGEAKKITSEFTLKKIQADFFQLKEFSLSAINLVYFDVFGARVQPELWEEELIKQVYDTMIEGGLLTTYSSKGSVRRIMQNIGFKVEKKQGPIGKREMINAWKQ